MRVNLIVNGRQLAADDVWEGESLLYVLRERLGLPGSKNACEQGECGSCTVRLDGVLVCACLVAAGQAEGRKVVTVEGLAGRARQRAQDPAQSAAEGVRATTAQPASQHGAAASPGESRGAAREALGSEAAPASPRTDAAAAPQSIAAAAGTRRTPTPPGHQAAADLSPVQQAFLDAGAVQCGFCTPGLLVAADDLLESNTSPSDEDIREALSGNLCRCTGYEKIMDAVRLAAARQGEATP